MNVTRVVLTLGDEIERSLAQQGIIFLSDCINTESATRVIALLHWLKSKQVPKIELFITSNGGEVESAFAIYDTIKAIIAFGIPVYTIASGYCYSAAMLILQAGTERWAQPNTSLMIHEVSGLQFGKTGEVEADVKFQRQLQDRFMEILTSRSKLSPKTLMKKITGKNWWLTVEEALKWGLIDKVMQNASVGV